MSKLPLNAACPMTPIRSRWWSLALLLLSARARGRAPRENATRACPAAEARALREAPGANRSWVGAVAFLRVQKVGGTSVHSLCLSLIHI